MANMDRAELLEKLVTTLHLNVAERKMLGAEPVRQGEITKELAAQMHQDFSDKKQAVHEFVTREWQHGQIDGIPILP